ncbi:Uncharacterised protein [Mycobacteroides abscessus subsp. abscessus]|nr:Uncharacterised protein [Mycobacteroides abscessus subsp. abscessus]
MPSRCFGLSSGSSEFTQPTIVPRLAFSKAPPIPKPPKPFPPESWSRRESSVRSRAALRRRSSY